MGIVEKESLSVRVFLLARFLGQPKHLQSRNLFTNNLCLDFIVRREIGILPRSLLQRDCRRVVFGLAAIARFFYGRRNAAPLGLLRGQLVGRRLSFLS